MKIYFGHNSNFDYQNELYLPIRDSILNQEHEIILPHEKNLEPGNSIEFLKTCDVMIAEVSFPATGLGIELGWADSIKLPIIYIHKQGSKLSKSLKIISDRFIEYSDTDDMIIKIKNELKNI